MPTVIVAASVRCRGRSGYGVVVTPTSRIRKAAKTDLVTKSFVTRWTLRRIFRPSATIAGTAAKSPLTSTTSATLRVISEPVPWAIASRAALSAGTSLTPSPTIAT